MLERNKRPIQKMNDDEETLFSSTGAFPLSSERRNRLPEVLFWRKINGDAPREIKPELFMLTVLYEEIPFPRSLFDTILREILMCRMRDGGGSLGHILPHSPRKL